MQQNLEPVQIEEPRKMASSWPTKLQHNPPIWSLLMFLLLKTLWHSVRFQISGAHATYVFLLLPYPLILLCLSLHQVSWSRTFSYNQKPGKNSSKILKNPLLTPPVSWGSGVGEKEVATELSFPYSYKFPYSFRFFLSNQDPTIPEEQSLLGKHLISQSAPVTSTNVNLNTLQFKNLSYKTMTTERKKTI